MNGPQRTAVSRKELWQKQKQMEFLAILCTACTTATLNAYLFR